MIELDRKYVFHIPLYRYDGGLVPIQLDDVLDELIERLGFESFYITKVKSVYKKRVYDEILLTVFTSNGNPEETFAEWFRANNDLLGQEAFAYEVDGRMIIRRMP